MARKTTYIYYLENHSEARGFNKCITVYRLRGHGEPELIGINNRLNSAAWHGDRGEALRLISERCGHRLAKPRGARFESPNINLWRV